MKRKKPTYSELMRLLKDVMDHLRIERSVHKNDLFIDGSKILLSDIIKVTGDL